MLTHKQAGYSQSFTVTLIMCLLLSQLLYSLSAAMCSSLQPRRCVLNYQFRSAPGDPRDIAIIFFTLAVGLACGMDSLHMLCYLPLFSVLLCSYCIMTNYAGSKTLPMSLKITIPENLNYQGLFDDIIKHFNKVMEAY